MIGEENICKMLPRFFDGSDVGRVLFRCFAVNFVSRRQMDEMEIEFYFKRPFLQ